MKEISYHAPPERVGVGAEVLAIDVTLNEVDEERREDETEKTDVERREQLLTSSHVTSDSQWRLPVRGWETDLPRFQKWEFIFLARK